MPCRDSCDGLSGSYPSRTYNVCPDCEKRAKFDWEGALCDVLQVLQRSYSSALEIIDPATIDAWVKHREEEEVRREAAKKSALAKLTSEEKKALGINV